MKGKLAAVALLATAVTIGGVYATWTFAEGNTSAANTTVNVAMTGVNATTEKGTLSVMVMGTNGFTVAVDDANNDHFPDIKKTGVITVTFTPSASASDDVKAYGIDVDCVVSYAPYTGGVATLEEWTYADKQIFSISSTSEAPIHLDKGAALKDGGVFTWTINADDVGIALGENFDDVKIDTLEKYNALNDILAKGHFVITVNECVPELE